MSTETTFVCDCCLRKADNRVGWAHISVNWADGDRQVMPDEVRDLCEICWSPLQQLLNSSLSNMPGSEVHKHADHRIQICKRIGRSAQSVGRNGAMWHVHDVSIVGPSATSSKLS